MYTYCYSSTNPQTLSVGAENKNETKKSEELKLRTLLFVHLMSSDWVLLLSPHYQQICALFQHIICNDEFVNQFSPYTMPSDCVLSPLYQQICALFQHINNGEFVHPFSWHDFYIPFTRHSIRSYTAYVESLHHKELLLNNI